MGIVSTVGKKLVQEIAISPLLKQMKKETKKLDRQYEKFLGNIEQNLEIDRFSVSKEYQEVAETFNVVLRCHDDEEHYTSKKFGYDGLG